MNGYIIKVGKKEYATDAENLMDAEDKFINEFPQFKDSKLELSEVGDIDLLSGDIVVF